MIFREGMIEKVDADYLRDKIYRPELERHILDDIREGLRLLGGIGLTAPYSVMLTIIGARDLHLPELDYGRSYGKPMNADMAVAPDAVIAEYDPNVSDTRIMPAMRNAFNYLWNGFGIAKDPQYTPEGQWIPRQS